MKTQFATLTLAVLGGLGTLAVPNTSQAANIGYVTSSKCSGGSDGTSAIIAAGHTPVLLSTIDAASLAPLAGFVYVNCFGAVYPANAAIDTAVANGMTLFVFDKSIGAVSPAAATHLPGTPSLVVTSAPDLNVDIPAGSPAATGPGGPINNTSLDATSYYTNRGWADLGSLPAGSTVLATTPDPNRVVEFSYNYGQGRVVYGSIPIDVFLSGGSGEAAGDAATAGVKAFTANLFAWALTSTTCASSGYTGTQLLWCQKICESGLTGKELDVWLQRWIRQFRKLPYCALPGGNPPPV